jgi:hypothetical protein
MDIEQFANAIPAINNSSTIASIACVVPTYFLRLQPATYRLVLSLGIIFGLSISAVVIAAVFWPYPHGFDRVFIVLLLIYFSPLVVVLIAILARIKRITRVGSWSSIVLVCVILDWAGMSFLFFSFS